MPRVYESFKILKETAYVDSMGGAVRFELQVNESANYRVQCFVNNKIIFSGHTCKTKQRAFEIWESYFGHCIH